MVKKRADELVAGDELAMDGDVVDALVDCQLELAIKESTIRGALAKLEAAEAALTRSEEENGWLYAALSAVEQFLTGSRGPRSRLLPMVQAALLEARAARVYLSSEEKP